MRKIKQLVMGLSIQAAAAIQEKKIQKTLEIAELNAENDLEEARANLDSAFLSLSKQEKLDAKEVINVLSDKISDIEDAEKTKERIMKIKAYLNEEVSED